MTIRSRLLLMLLPPLVAFVSLISIFFYFNWSQEILDSFRSQLRSIVISTAESIPPEEIAWITTHLNDPSILQDERYRQYRKKIVELKQQLPINNLYIVQIESVPEGQEPVPSHAIQTSDSVDKLTYNHRYRQVYLLDTADSSQLSANQPGDYDYSETDEHLVYFTKHSIVSSIYLAKKSQERFISAYAPIINASGDVIALLGADVSMGTIDLKLKKAVLMIVTSSFITLFFVIITGYIIADRISQPVQELNRAALAIAAGDYEANIIAKGPKEIFELANTFNTMTECLEENINRMKESSLIRERMYGEYECARLLQTYMLQKVVEDFEHPLIKIKLVSALVSGNQKGLLFKADSEPHQVSFILREAKELGFTALFRLNQNTYLPASEIYEETDTKISVDLRNKTMTSSGEKIILPFIWSINRKEFILHKKQTTTGLESQDMVFLYNHDLIEQFESTESLKKWLSKVLRHFAEDGLEAIQTMLTNELNFLTKKQSLKKNCYLIITQVKFIDFFKEN